MERRVTLAIGLFSQIVGLLYIIGAATEMLPLRNALGIGVGIMLFSITCFQLAEALRWWLVTTRRSSAFERLFWHAETMMADTKLAIHAGIRRGDLGAAANLLVAQHIPVFQSR